MDLFDVFSSPAPAASSGLDGLLQITAAGGATQALQLPLPRATRRKRGRAEGAEADGGGDSTAVRSALSLSSAATAPAASSSSSAASTSSSVAAAGSSAAAAAVIEFDAEPPADDSPLLAVGPNQQHSSAAAPASSSASTNPQSSSSAEASVALVNRPSFGIVNENRTTVTEEWQPPSADWKPAKSYPFTLDPFQKRAVECLERNESVLVSAHTSAGKTVVAEYAIAMALRDKQRVIYTSPIKALSNQKYRDLYEEFSDVGLMTGDVTINPNASCLVMTTEILRSMLYRGSEIMREVKWVVFDEIHYMRDRERGVVWEESIIMLPHSVRFVFLSATIPNSKEFAQWIAKIHHQTCHVVYTDYRPTPLQHFIFPTGAEGVYMVVDEKGRFREDNFNKAMATLSSSSLQEAVADVTDRGAGKKRNMKKSGAGKGGPSDLYRIMRMCMERHYDPVIVFSFAKRECEQNALQMAKLDFTTADEKVLIEQVFVNAIDSLSEDDKKLPQLDAILPLLKRGVGIHHGGLLPILKEVIEILFQESLIKILCATETFSMGLNMPARTVVFTASRKWDGTDFRWISPGEYIQMSGRAGRRGLDDRGIVIQMIDEKMESDAAKNILNGSADPLNSAFHLGYNMLLNLMRVEDADPEKMMALSFHQFQNERAVPEMQAELARVTEQASALVIPGEKAVAEYYALCASVEEVREAMRAVVTKPEFVLPFLQPGRMVRVSEPGGEDWGWGVVVNFQKRSAAVGMLGVPEEEAADAAGAAAAADGSGAGGRAQFIVDVLLACSIAGATATDGKRRRPRPAEAAAATTAGASSSSSSSPGAEFRVVPVLLPTLAALSSVRVYLPKDLRPKEARDAMGDRIQEVLRRFPGGVPLLDPIEDMQISGPEFGALVAKSLALQTRIAANPLQTAPDRDDRFDAYRRKVEHEQTAASLRERIKSCRALLMKDTLRKMKRVLRRLGAINAENVVQMKGRVACEINTADELLVTELVFNGVFLELDAAQAAALLSCLVYTDKGGDDEAPPLREELAAPLRQLQDAARRVAQVSQDCKIEMDAEEFVASFRPDMMELVYAWVNGAKFVDVCTMTKEFEGTIIRVIRRLEELCRQLADAAKAIGDEALERKFKEASAKMRRDIIFAASLYL